MSIQQNLSFPYSQSEFKLAAKLIYSQLEDTEINCLWNNSGNGNPALVTTTHRWMRRGPDTKNPRFEPWIITLAKDQFGLSDQFTDKLKLQKIKHLQCWLECDYIDNTKDKATVAGLVAYYNIDPCMSHNQWQLVNRMFNKFKHNLHQKL